MSTETPARSAFIGINWASVWNSAVGDIRFWLVPGVGTLALAFFMADTSISVAYVTQHSMLANSGWGYAIVGTFIAVGISFLVHFGPHRVFGKLKGRLKKTFGAGAIAAAFAASLIFAVSFFQAVYQEDLQEEARLEHEAAGLRTVADSELNTAVEEAALARAETVLGGCTADNVCTGATGRRIKAEQWKDTAMSCPDSGYCAAVIPIQRALQVTEDGLVKGNVTGCTDCGETMNAINQNLAEAIAAEAEAVAAFEAAAQALKDKRNLVEGAVQKKVTAALLDTEQTYLRSMRLVAEWDHWPGIGVKYEDDPGAVDERAEVLALWAGSGIATFVTVLSFFFGLFRFQVRDPDTGEDHFKIGGGSVPAAPAPDDPPGLPGGGGALAKALPPSERPDDYAGDIPLSAPQQRFESDAAYAERMERYAMQAETGLRSFVEDSEGARRARRRAEIMRRKGARAEDRALDLMERELNEDDDQALEIPPYNAPVSRSRAHTETFEESRSPRPQNGEGRSEAARTAYENRSAEDKLFGENPRPPASGAGEGRAPAGADHRGDVHVHVNTSTGEAREVPGPDAGAYSELDLQRLRDLRRLASREGKPRRAGHFIAHPDGRWLDIRAPRAKHDPLFQTWSQLEKDAESAEKMLDEARRLLE